MATGQNILDVVCYDLLEDGGLVLGLITTAQFLDMLNLTIVDLAMKTGMLKAISTQQILASNSPYTIPDSFLRVDAAFCAGRYLAMTTTVDLNNAVRGWRSADPGIPQQWRADQLPVKSLAIFPVASYNGAVASGPSFYPAGVSPASHRGLTIVGVTAPAALSAIGQTIPLLPDDVAMVCLPAGVEQRIFASDSELKDMQRSAYCGAQYAEMVNALRSYMGEVEDEDAQ